jgi:hypothetical protein
MNSKTLYKDTTSLLDTVIKTNSRSLRFPKPTSNSYFTVVPGTFLIATTTLKHREKDSLCFKFAIWNSEFTKIFRAKMLEPDVIDGMMYDSHLISLGIANTDGGG